jgi:putative ABC transport system permease protein
MRWLRQTLAMMALNLRTIPQRLSSSAVAIIGIAGVVVVFISVLSIAAGFSAAMRQSGSPQRALVMRSGADSEMTSGLGGPEADIIKQAPGIRRDGQTPLVSAELYVIIDLPKKSTPDAPANVPMRGIEPTAMKVREEVSLTQGRMFQFGTNEVIVGRGASVQFANLELGNTIVSGQNRWQVVGIFEADGGVAESEIWCDSRVLQGAYRRGNSYQSVLARLDSSDSLKAFTDWLTSNPAVNVMVRRENEYYAGQSRALTSLIQVVGYGIAALMGIGAIFGAILTMYTAVATRAREIATLRALGFNTGSVLVSVLGESRGDVTDTVGVAGIVSVRLDQFPVNVSAGSVLAARRAGRYDAASDVKIRTPAAVARVRGSQVGIPYRIDVNDRAASRPAARPIATPTIPRKPPRLTTSHAMSRGRAPRASRVPISRVRWRTTYDVTP